jgi:hypothetical protein
VCGGVLIRQGFGKIKWEVCDGLIPRERIAQPDRERIALRYDEFLAAG